ncbi:Fe-S cluster assembly protein SufD [Veronia pacifica]|uniref:Fe-S cluster assembly protein SufD n=1 Tax=Veronia pacifica TaxID=1080227 RepID=A0A1C3EC36_9GAMM|nr:Fe-S cluster assembly protein SufD [Veronia pacifica]ODA30816.1 Fe-S cluster assembly protein SufD [Veronia pacifica]
MAGSPVNNNPELVLKRLKSGREDDFDDYANAHWLNAIDLGLPGKKDEDWKYTSLDAFSELDFTGNRYAALTKAGVDQHRLDFDSYLLTFVDGEFRPALSDFDQDDIQVVPLSDSTKQQLPEPVLPEFFLHVTEALNQSGVSIHVSGSAEKPIYVLNMVSQCQQGMSHIRNHLSIASGGEACVIEHLVSLTEPFCDKRVDGNGHFTSSRLTMNVGDNAKLDHYKLIQGADRHFHFGHNDIRAGRDTRVQSQTFLLSGKMIRHHTSAVLDGENSELMINSLSLPCDGQTYDTRSYLEHNKSHCNSHQLHKIIAQDTAKAVFNGMIKVAPNALKTDGQMDNHNLLLSDDAEVNTKPQLEIYADDVKCSHGTTTGSLSSEQLFYLRTRGIEKVEAERLITQAFAGEVTEAIEIPDIQEYVFRLVLEKLAKEPL